MAAAGHEVGYDESEESSDPDSGYGTGAGRRIRYVEPEELIISTYKDMFDVHGRRFLGVETLRQVGELVSQSHPASRKISRFMNPVAALKGFITSKRDWVDELTIEQLIKKIKKERPEIILNSLLHLAIKYDKRMIIEKLIEAGATDLITPDVMLRRAVFMGNFEMVKTLIEDAEIDINVTNIYRIESPLMLASHRGFLDIVKYLVKHGADVQARDGENIALIDAISENHLDVVKYLIENAGATIIAGRDENGSLGCLATAVYFNRFEILRYLIEEADADIHANRDIALRFAAAFGNLEMVRYLLAHGADVHAYGDFALRLARSNGHVAVVEFLSENYGFPDY
jgi:ankyrin repeat protein